MSPPSRYEVPFYALPLVNFFIIDEMGVTNQDKELLSALQSLEFSPAYAVKGNQNCTWWAMLARWFGHGADMRNTTQ